MIVAIAVLLFISQASPPAAPATVATAGRTLGQCIGRQAVSQDISLTPEQVAARAMAACEAERIALIQAGDNSFMTMPPEQQIAAREELRLRMRGFEAAIAGLVRQQRGLSSQVED